MFRLSQACVLFVVAAALVAVPVPVSEGGGPPKIFFEGSGTVGLGPQSCLLFHADESNNTFALGNTEGFGPGDRVWVSGEVNNQSPICFPVIKPAIENNTINRFFAGCGEIGPGPQGCLALTTEGGETFFLSGDLGDIGGLFDEIFVTGIVREDSFVCFPVIATELQVLTVDECVNPDINGDGVVNALDLLLLLQEWGKCDGCPEDLNRDGLVGLLDLLILLSAWG